MLRSKSPTTVTHCTLLDAFSGLANYGKNCYGKYADWSDSYFSVGNIFRDGIRTSTAFQYAHNVDVTWFDPVRRLLPVYCGLVVTGSAVPTCYRAAGSTHEWPHHFYTNTIPPSFESGAGSYGFALSKEAGGVGKPNVLSIG